MRRAVLCPLACALALATAVALPGAAAALGDPSPRDPPATAEAAARRFYAAANDVILTGDAATLAAAVGPDFVDHAPPPGVAPGRAGLARYLAALHAAAPGAELVVEGVVAAGDRALAWVAVRGADRGAFLGLPLSAELPLWGAVDAFRVADGRVVERWGDAGPLALLEPLSRAALDAGLPARQVVALERLAVPPGGLLAERLSGEARLVHLEAGALAVAVAPDSPGPALLAPAAAGGTERSPTALGPGGGASLAAGDLLALPPLTAYALRNDAATSAAALVAAVRRPGAKAHATGRCDSVHLGSSPSCAAGGADAAPAVTVWPLAEGRAIPLPAGPLAAAAGRATLAPGAALPLDAAAGPALLHVEAGTVGLEAEHGTAWVRRGGAGAGGEVAAGALGAGDGALLRPGTAATLRNLGDGPLVVLLLTITPATGPAAPSSWASGTQGDARISGLPLRRQRGFARHHPDRLVADAELGGQIPQRATGRHPAQGGFLLGRLLPRPRRVIGVALRSPRTTVRGQVGECHRPRKSHASARANPVASAVAFFFG